MKKITFRKRREHSSEGRRARRGRVNWETRCKKALARAGCKAI